MKIDILSLFPEILKGPLSESIIGKAVENKIVNIDITNFRDFSTNKHHNVDDTPFGGGAGMLLKPQPMLDAFARTQQVSVEQGYPTGRVILTDPAGKRFEESDAVDLAKEDHLTFLCGHYEGFDERIKSVVTDEYSIGDFVLTGGELPALVMIDATVRLIKGVLGNQESAPDDSFSTGLLEYPQYTRPADFRGSEVPPVLTSGDHQKIADWRQKESLRKTYLRRPDLIDYDKLSKKQKELLADVKIEEEKK
ncbi:tRNA (guanosine(37)-N1)-methyltransferase TrmD [Fructilactobacillus fructivorans]|uniref:tRNA (guanine-N(1)-)-methyltransferase n=1 Tax=Fructilactobacillus fructivorans TaxID=1614 RepID=A0A0C1M746_9LACO|nr:tRNA (guanosine(37)-N1)-methyltransferase TrmD [Fructilactobacillus fructivorans]KID42174.1 tRNA (Guanine37-N1) -methyltransferase [Fructilactobacillus fructivorans]MCT0152067.1 tRNA (guanosine(37)-N1)-methyltransferase TrmD [Fructilactobacillus fructivorans]MCT2867959.1 tRNA (guanosine(37)-N1)-methyltransferase TrmD [Fructilactobacillus fructivorans]MCT2868459.1 tRNA (guanosine(37)-N1)-methyltransferase TrmD [Fructilactobacillus fructivorans]MCT2873459.1 tRNA (guanosine(37)-N1)-methyltrans